MNFPPFASLVVIAVAMLCGSCGDDPELVEKRDRQEAEITRLKGELAVMEEQLGKMPPDVSLELEKAGKQEREQLAEIARLDAEVAGVTAKKRALQAEFDSYRAKYPLE